MLITLYLFFCNLLFCNLHFVAAHKLYERLVPSICLTVVLCISFSQGLNCVDKDQSKSKNIGLVETQRTCSPSKAIPLHYAPLNKKRGDRDERPKEQECLQRCNPFTPIPLHYASLQKSKEGSADEASRDTSEDSGAGKISPVSEPDRSGSSTDYGTNEGFAGCASNTDDENVSKSWHFEAKFQLLRKAAITYFVLAKEFYEIKKYGHTLRHLRYAVHCYGECF